MLPCFIIIRSLLLAFILALGGGGYRPIVMSKSPRAHSNASPVCAVTGGSNGIGLAIVKTFLANEMKVYSIDIFPSHDDTCREALSSGRLSYLQADVADPIALNSCLQRAFDECGRLDCVVNNAAVYESHEIGNILWEEETTREQIDAIVRTNLGGVIHGTRTAFQLMKKKMLASSNSALSDKTIVNISSMGAFRSTPRRAVYGSTKAAILHFSQTADCDLRDEGVRVFSVCPGICDTEMGHMGGERNRLAVSKLKGGERTRPELVAEAVLGLVQRKEEWINCPFLIVDNHEIKCGSQGGEE